MDKGLIKQMMAEADSMFTLLQRLDLKPTEGNLQILTGCLGSLKFMYNTLKEEAEKDGAEADPE